MALTKVNFNEIQNASEINNVINIDKKVSLKQEVILPTKTPPQSQFDGAIWVDPLTNNLKVKINAATYDLSPQGDFNNITISSPYTFPLNGNVGVVNNLTISGSGTTVDFRSSAVGGVQWSVLEVKGNLTIDSGCTLNLIRVPIIVRGSILGTGTITSPSGVNGGAAGIGGPGGTAGRSGYYRLFNTTPFEGVAAGLPGGTAPSTWTGKSGTLGSSMPVEYGISSGKGGDGGRGTGGGGGGAYRHNNTAWSGGSSGAGSNPAYSGGTGQVAIWLEGYYYGWQFGGGGGGAGGPGTSANYPSNIGTGGPSANGGTGENGGSAGTLNTPYTGVGTPSSGSAGSVGTSGGAGGQGNQYNFYNGNPAYDILPTDGSPGGTGGNGGTGGGTGGAHLSIYCAGSVGIGLTIRPGKGGLTGGSTSLAGATTGSLWLFTPTGSETISGIDLTGITGTPPGPSGSSLRYALSNSTEVTNFLTGILYQPNGPSPAKTQVAITYP